MLTRRGFVGGMSAAFVTAGAARLALAQSPAAIVPAETVWLNANEYPDGPPAACLTAMSRALGAANRYHYEEFASFYAALAASVMVTADHVLVGAGSSEVLQCAIEAFVTPTRPFITAWPSFDWGPELVAAKGRPVVKVPLKRDYSADVKSMRHEAERAGGGLIYLCNPNNPTSSMTSPHEIRWLAENLPPATQLLVDEAYIHFTEMTEAESALSLVRQGRNVLVMRTFSKIYGMAGVRVGFVVAPPELIARVSPYRNNVISIIGVRAVLAALALGQTVIDRRRARNSATRADLTRWCQRHGFPYIEPHANFVMIDTARQVGEVSAALAAKGIVAGRPFPTLPTMLRVTIGKDGEMAKFKTALAAVLRRS
jgi:histidinol-phosphate aminotransferase